MKTSVTLTATPVDPVVRAMRSIGFSAFKASGNTSGFRLSTAATGYTAPEFVQVLNDALKKSLGKGDKPFRKPAYNGRTVCTYATLHGWNYNLEIGAGMVIVNRTQVPKP